MPNSTTRLSEGLTFRELVYEDSNLPKLVKILMLNKVELRGTIQENIVIPQAEEAAPTTHVILFVTVHLDSSCPCFRP